jgi:hypothetical protein
MAFYSNWKAVWELKKLGVTIEPVREEQLRQAIHGLTEVGQIHRDLDL